MENWEKREESGGFFFKKKKKREGRGEREREKKKMTSYSTELGNIFRYITISCLKKKEG